MTAEAAAVLGTETTTFGPWQQYGFSAAAMTRSFAPKPVPDNGARYLVRVGDVLAGGMIIRDPWLIGPYLQMLAVLPDFQRTGVGGRMLGWFEARARAAKQRNIWLCVTASNQQAQQFYFAHGWALATDIDGLIQDDIGERLLRKRLSSVP